MTDDEQMQILDEAGKQIHDRLGAGGRKVEFVVTVVVFADGGHHMASAMDPEFGAEFEGAPADQLMAAAFHTAADHLTLFAHAHGVCAHGNAENVNPSHHRGTA